jgi:TolB protein
MTSMRLNALMLGAALMAGAVVAARPTESGIAARPLPPQQAPPAQQQPQTEISLSLTNPGYQPKLAIPDFVVQGGDAKLRELASLLADTLWNDLDFEREFYVIDRKASAGIPVSADPAAVPYDRWEQIGADFVVLGVIKPTPAGFDVDVRVVRARGANKGRQDHGQNYGPCTLTNARFCAHYISDDMHAKLRQTDGVARTKIAFTSDRGATRVTNRRIPNGGDAKEIYIADYDGANQTRITANNALNISPVWGADTRTLAYVSYQTGFPDIYVTKFDGRAPTRPASGNDRNQHFLPEISPDGSKVAFASSRGGSMDIWVANVGGGGLRNLTPNTPSSAEVAPTWSPSGDQIAFTSDRTGRTAIYIMRADGLDQQRLYGEMQADRPTWSPLNFIAFTVVGGGAKDIALYDINTRSVRMLTDGRGSNESPSFAPNGRHIAFVTTRWGREQVAIVGIDGSRIKRVTESGNNGWPNWSPSPK